MSHTDLDYYMQEMPGGVSQTPHRMMLGSYGWRMLGPEQNKDAVIFSAAIDSSVVPLTGRKNFLPRGRVFSMTEAGTMIPGIPSDAILSTVAMLIGSDSDSGDVTGVYYGDPAMSKGGASAYKDHFNANFQSLAAGYVYETSEYDPDELNQLVPGALLTAEMDNINDFDTAGRIRIAQPYIDQVIGIVVRSLGPATSDNNLTTIAFQGLAIPRLNKDAVDAALLRP